MQKSLSLLQENQLYNNFLRELAIISLQKYLYSENKSIFK